MSSKNRIEISRLTSAILFTFVTIFKEVQGQGDGVVTPEPATCGYGSGSMATAIILTFFCTLIIFAFFLYLWKRRQDAKKDNHLILESDPERGVKAEYAFDNPGFKDATLTATSEKHSKPDSSSKIKWGKWSPLTAFNLKPEKKRALDDLALGNPEVKVVALKSQDFTGLGFNICGNMKEGIFIKDILHRGPAFESGKLNPGDRINSVTISFEHMVYEDALAILSYASPYEVMIEAKSGRIISYIQGQGQNPIHPIYRSSSMIDLYHTEKSAKKKLFGDDYSSSSNYSSLQKSRSNVTTLERKESKSPRPNQPKPKKVDRSPHKTTPEMHKMHLEQRMTDDDQIIREDRQKSDYSPHRAEHRAQKFGIRVLPVESQQISPKITEQNQNNINIEKNMEEIPIQSIDEVDVKLQPPQARKREKKSPEPTAFERNDSGIRRDKDGIPLEIPEHMLDAAVMARRNRKSSIESGLTNGEDIGKKTKGKAPVPPSAEIKLNFSLGGGKTKAFDDLSTLGTNDSSPIENNVRYGSDSEEETDNNMSSVNTIELNSSDITIHQTEEEERKARKTASTGDLSKMKKAPRSNSGTLERAQSLDITDTSGPSLVKMRTYDATENLLIDREPRLSLILDGLTTFQKKRLKKSTEWGNLEDVIMNFNQNNDDYDERRKSEPQFNAVMDRVIQIKRESQESVVVPDDVVRQYQINALDEPKAPKVFNKIWPDEQELTDSKFEQSGWKRLERKEEIPKRSVKNDDKSYMKRQQVPVVPERTKIKVNEVLPETKVSEGLVTFSTKEKHEMESGEKTPLPAERVSKIDVVLESTSQKKTIEQTPPNLSSKNTNVMNLSNQPSSPITVQFECVKPIPPKRERTPEKETVIDLAKNRHLQPVTSYERQVLSQTCSQMAKDLNPQGEMIKDEWEIDTLNNTSPPQSMTLVDEVMDSYNKNYGNTVTVVQTEEVAASPGASLTTSNIPDETKTIGNLKNATADFIFNEQSIYETETNIPDDVKVSRSSYESLEARKPESKPKSDDAKTEDLLVTHVTVTENGGSNLHSLELSINNEPNELYTTALDNTILSEDAQNDVTVIVSKPDKITVRKVEAAVSEPLVEITENSFSRVTKSPNEEMAVNVVRGPDSIKDEFKVEIMQSKYSKFEVDAPAIHTLKKEPLIQEFSMDESLTEGVKTIDDESPAISLTEIKPMEDERILITNESPKEDKKTYVTEIQVLTPNTTTLSDISNVSEVQVTPQSNDDHLESAFENYVKNFESKLEAFESNMQNFENNLEEFIRDEPKSIVLEEKDVEKQASKIQEIAEEQLKTLPEMRFTTSSYESGRKTPEKRHSFELLRSNFEKASNDKSPPRRDSNTPPKSRIPIATTMKTPPMSPERRDSRNLEIENDTAILELMSSSTIHSTPFTSKIKPPSVGTKNVSVTSIKNNSKIPSGLPTLSSRPPIPPKKTEDNGVQISSPNGGTESSFKQWVFNPNSNVSNVTVGKEK